MKKQEVREMQKVEKIFMGIVIIGIIIIIAILSFMFLGYLLTEIGYHLTPHWILFNC